MNDEQFELLCQKHLDGESTSTERESLLATITADPERKRRFEEFVALEGLLLAVGNSDRTSDLGAVIEPGNDRSFPPLPLDAHSPFGSPSDLADHSRESIASEEELALSGAWMSTAAGAILLAVIVWFGLSDTPEPGADPQIGTHAETPDAPLEVASLSSGLHAVVQETEDDSIQFIWIASSSPGLAPIPTNPSPAENSSPTLRTPSTRNSFPRKETDE